MINRCVCCGEEIPEGRTVCWRCEHGELPDRKERRKPWLFKRLRQMIAILALCRMGKSNQQS